MSRPGARLLLSLIVATACRPHAEAAPPSAAAFSVRDSSGIALADNVAPAWSGAEGWRIDPAPRISLPSESSYVSRLRRVTRLSDGRIALLSVATSQVVIFDTTGQVVRTVGRRGQGPGEFRTPEGMQRLPGDSLVVWDTFFGPRTTFDSTGKVVRISQIDLARVDEAIGRENWSEELTPLPGGAFIAYLHPRGNTAVTTMGRVYRPPVGLMLIRSDYTSQPLGWFNGRSMVHLESAGEQPTVLAPLHLSLSVAVSDLPSRIFVSNGQPEEVRVFDGDGRLLRIIRRHLPGASFPDQVLDSNRLAFVGAGQSAAGRREREAVWKHMPEPTPSIVGLQVDSDGYLWIATSGDGWQVFTPDGRWLGQVRMHGIRQVFEIGRDYIIGLTEDAHGVQQVHEFGLHRDAPTSTALRP